MEEIQFNVQPENNQVTTKKMNFLQRIIGIIVSPGAVMQNLAERPRVLYGILASIFTLPLYCLARFSMYTDYTRQAQLKSADIMKQMYGVEQTPEAIEQSLPMATWAGIGTFAAKEILSILFVALIFFAILKIMGGQGKFKAYLSVAGYSYTIVVLYHVVTFIASFFAGSLYLDQSLTSLINLLPQEMKGQFLYGMASGVDLFSIWFYVVLAIGLVAVSKLKKKYVYGTVCVVFLIGLLIIGATTAAAGAFM